MPQIFSHKFQPNNVIYYNIPNFQNYVNVSSIFSTLTNLIPKHHNQSTNYITVLINNMTIHIVILFYEYVTYSIFNNNIYKYVVLISIT